MSVQVFLNIGDKTSHPSLYVSWIIPLNVEMWTAHLSRVYNTANEPPLTICFLDNTFEC